MLNFYGNPHLRLLVAARCIPPRDHARGDPASGSEIVTVSLRREAPAADRDASGR